MNVLFKRLTDLASACKVKFDAIDAALGRIPRITVGTAAPTNPQTNDLWVDTNS